MMEIIFEKLAELFNMTGFWVVPVISLIGIIILGILKYTNCFKKIDEKYRHYIYLGISLVFSIGGTAIYLAIIKMFDWNVFFALATIIWGINQSAYNLFKVTPIKELFIKLLDFIKELIRRSNAPKTEE